MTHKILALASNSTKSLNASNNSFLIEQHQAFVSWDLAGYEGASNEANDVKH